MSAMEGMESAMDGATDLSDGGQPEDFDGDATHDTSGATGAPAQPETFEIGGQRYTSEQLQQALDYRANMDRWNKSNTERSEQLAAERRELEALRAEVSAGKGKRGPDEETEELPDYGDDDLAEFGSAVETRITKQVERMLKPVLDHLGEVNKTAEAEREAEMLKGFNKNLESTAKKWGVNEDSLYRIAVDDGLKHPLDYYANKVFQKANRADEVPNGNRRPGQGQPLVGPGGTPASIGDQDGLQYAPDDPRAEESDRKWFQKFLKSQGAG